MNRIDLKFKELKEKNQKAMIPFVTAGDPDLETTKELVKAMEAAGADIIELGIPYSDPLADGPVIQESSLRALNAGAKTSRIMEMVKELRKETNVPLLYLVYYNSVYRYGVEKFISEAKEAGIDGLIIPDLTIEERQDTIAIADKYDVYIIPLVAPTSKERIHKITEGAKGFVYCVSVAGVTGVRQNISTDIKGYMEIVSSYTDKPKALGFGISSAEMAAGYKDYCDAIIVGSAVVKRVAEGKTKEEKIKSAAEFVGEIKRAINQ